MTESKPSNGRRIIDYMARDYDSLLQAMRAQIPELLPEWQDYESEADFGNVLLQLFAHMGDILSYYQDRVAGESFLSTARSRSSVIDHLSLIGYKLGTAAPAAASLTLTVPEICDDIITIQQGNAFATKSQADKPSVRFEYTREVDLTIDCSKLNPVNGHKHYAGIPVEEGRLVQAEILGESDGQPNQRFQLPQPGLILRSLGQGQTINRDITLLVGEEAWSLQESLAFSREQQPDYIIDIDAEDRATIIFGDGAFGAIPPKGSVITATYRLGGGRHGNVGAKAIQTIVDASQLTLLGATATNPQPATGGADRETIAHAVRQAPAVFRSLKRAVTAADFEALALNFNGVGKVRATAAGWNTINLFVAPQGGGYVSDILKANLLAYFEDKRPITTLIEIEDVDYVKIFITAKIGVNSYYDADVVTEQVQAVGGHLLAFENVDFAQTLYLSKFYEAIEAIDGVDYVTITEFRSQRETEDTAASRSKRELEDGKIELGDHEIPTKSPEADYAAGLKVTLEAGA